MKKISIILLIFFISLTCFGQNITIEGDEVKTEDYYIYAPGEESAYILKGEDFDYIMQGETVEVEAGDLQFIIKNNGITTAFIFKKCIVSVEENRIISIENFNRKMPEVIKYNNQDNPPVE